MVAHHLTTTNNSSTTDHNSSNITTSQITTRIINSSSSITSRKEGIMKERITEDKKVLISTETKEERRMIAECEEINLDEKEINSMRNFTIRQFV